MDVKYFKAFIRVVKSIDGEYGSHFGSNNVVEERLIKAIDKDEVKKILLEKYPQFFPNNKIYSKETKDDAQFFYVVIFELYEYEKRQVENPVSWECAFCGQKHVNEYISQPRINNRLYGSEKKFCRSEEDYCINEFSKQKNEGIEFPDDPYFIKKDSPNYIYKITEIESGKSYIGKTRNAPFFRWWNHLTHSSSPFGTYLRSTKLSDWSFEVLECLPAEMKDTDVFDIESKYIIHYDSIKNGFNTTISKKQKEMSNTNIDLFSDDTIKQNQSPD